MIESEEQAVTAIMAMKRGRNALCMQEVEELVRAAFRRGLAAEARRVRAGAPAYDNELGNREFHPEDGIII